MAVQLEKGWQYMEEGIAKLKRILEGEREVGPHRRISCLLETLYELNYHGRAAQSSRTTLLLACRHSLRSTTCCSVSTMQQHTSSC